MKVCDRVYEDYIKKSRLCDYENVLKLANSKGYKMMGINEFAHHDILGGELILVNRHDIDTSPRVAKKMFEIEKKVYGDAGSSTFYFRQSTFDKDLIKEINGFGYEASYHYEEIATYLKKNRIKDPQKILSCLPKIREIFEENLNEFRQQTGAECKTVSAHGDFVNVKLDISNKLLLDKKTRMSCMIETEAYDEIIEGRIEARFADQHLLGVFSQNVQDAILNKKSPILILTHPRNWEVDILFNTKDNIVRLIEGVSF